jgi:hypothetical protein
MQPEAVSPFHVCYIVLLHSNRHLPYVTLAPHFSSIVLISFHCFKPSLESPSYDSSYDGISDTAGSFSSDGGSISADRIETFTLREDEGETLIREWYEFIPKGSIVRWKLRKQPKASAEVSNMLHGRCIFYVTKRQGKWVEIYYNNSCKGWTTTKYKNIDFIVPMAKKPYKVRVVTTQALEDRWISIFFHILRSCTSISYHFFPFDGIKEFEVWPGRNRFCCRGKCMIGPNLRTFAFTNVLLISTSILLITVVCQHIDSDFRRRVMTSVCSALFSISTISLWKVSGMDPGIIPREPFRDDFKQQSHAPPVRIYTSCCCISC